MHTHNTKQNEKVLCHSTFVQYFVAIILCTLTWIYTVVKMFPIIKPDLCQSSIVVVHYFRCSPRKTVGGGLAEHMSHMGTSSDLKDTTTHPNLQPPPFHKTVNNNTNNQPSIMHLSFALF